MQDFGLSNATPELFLKEHQLTRIGFNTTISGVQFDACYARRVVDTIDELK